MSGYLRKTILVVMVVVSTVHFGVSAKSESGKDALSKYVDTGMEVSGVHYPHYNEDGELQAQIYGQHAVMLENSRVKITNLKIELYDDGKVSATIFTPICYSNIDIGSGKTFGDVLEVESDDSVLIETPQFTLSGKGFSLWIDKKKNVRFEILNDSKMLVRKEARKAEGLKL